MDFGKTFLTNGGGVDKFLELGFSKLAASALNWGDLPRTRTLSGLNDMLLGRCALSGTADLPVCEMDDLRLGLYHVKHRREIT